MNCRNDCTDVSFTMLQNLFSALLYMVDWLYKFPYAYHPYSYFLANLPSNETKDRGNLHYAGVCMLKISLQRKQKLCQRKSQFVDMAVFLGGISI